VPDVDYDDTFSPTVRLDSLRVILHLAASHGWFRGQDDVTGAFLHGKLDHVIYMRQPEGFEDGTGRAARLLLPLYGLKQSARQWNKYMYERLTSIGMKRTITDNAVYVRQNGSDTTILAIHVDNFMSFSNSKVELQKIRRQLHEIFEMNEEDPSWIMGFRLIDNPSKRTVSICHKSYIETILRRFKMESCNPCDTPMVAGLVLTKLDCPTTDSEKKEMESYPYRELVGALIWISLIAHFEITHASYYLAQFSANPGKAHWNAAKRVLRYLAGVRSSVLMLGGDRETSTTLVGYSDSDWARDVDTRRSISGYAYRLGNGTISWSSKKQTTVAASSTEGEYMALSHTVKQGLWLRNFLIEIGLNLDEYSIEMNVDNTGTIDLSKDPRFHSRTKHIPIHHHFVRERVEDGTFVVVHCPTEDQLADLFTKPLPRPIFTDLVNRLGLVSFEGVC
jgi:hypothetical protein